MNRFLLLALLFVVALACSTSSRASIITYEFAGTLSQVSVFNAPPPPAGVMAGATFMGTFSFDDSTPASFTYGNPPQFQNYAGALTGFTLMIGSNSYTMSGVLNQFGESSSQMAQVVNQSGGPIIFQDGFSITSESHDYSDPTHQQQARLQLGIASTSANPTGTTSTALTGINLDLNQFTDFRVINYEISDYNPETGLYNSEYFVHGNITSLTLVAVPEPANLVLLAAGIGCLLGRTIYRRRMTQVV